ncbi:hypothetical protein [Limimaricola pyoseonensis]|nr:hypothetical protein [Limimaricola pyoseonensis]
MILIAALVLAATPAVVGITLWDNWPFYHIFPIVLIVMGPVFVLSLFVALTPVLQGWWLQKRRTRGGDRSHGEQEDE